MRIPHVPPRVMLHLEEAIAPPPFSVLSNDVSMFDSGGGVLSLFQQQSSGGVALSPHHRVVRFLCLMSSERRVLYTMYKIQQCWKKREREKDKPSSAPSRRGA